MGLGFETTSTPWKRRLWARPSVAGLEKELRRVYAQQLGDALLSSRLSVQCNERTVYAQWHPAEGGLELELLQDGCIRASANTTLVGPGYHAYLISLLDVLSQELNITWNFAEGADETGFAETRDCDALENEMLVWLRSICRVCLDASNQGGDACAISMPIDAPRPTHRVAAYSVMGTWSREQFAGAIESPQALRALAGQFFPWWSRNMDAAFWLGMAQVVAWTDFPWVTPRDQHERATGEFALRCIERARALDASREPPEGFAELRALLDGAVPVKSPRSQGIGHRRGANRFKLFGGWTVELPGHFVARVLNDSNNLQLDDGNRAVYGSSLRVDGENGVAPSAETLLRSAGDTTPDLKWEDGHLRGEARWQEEGDCRHLLAAIAFDRSLLLLTITDNASAPRAWSENVARSAHHPPGA